MKRFMSSKSTALQSPKVRPEFSPLFGARVPNNWCWPNDTPVLNTENIFSISILADQPVSSLRRTLVGCLGILIAELVRTI
jgi:hypothetical protein